MSRLIPRKTKVRISIGKFDLGDIILAAIGVAVALALFFTNFGDGINFVIGGVWIVIVVTLFFKLTDDLRLYRTLGYLFRFFAQKKKYSKEAQKGFAKVDDIMPYIDIKEGSYIDYGEYYAQVIEVNPIEFSLLNEYKQNAVIECFANVIRILASHQSMNIVKINKAMILDNYIYNENRKYDALMELQYEGEISAEEVKAREAVFEERVSQMEVSNRTDKIYKDYFYIVVFDKDKQSLETTINSMINTFYNSVTPISSHRLRDNELVTFLKANYGKEFDERELEGISMFDHANWSKPDSIRFQAARMLINNKPYRQFVITDYPLEVGNAWGAPFFLLDRTKVVTKFKPVDRFKAEEKIDKGIMEMEAKLYSTGRSSKQIENATHLETLRILLQQLKNNNEQLYDVNTFITCEEPARKDVRTRLRQEGFKYSEMFGRQIDAFISSNISMRDNINEFKRHIPTTSLAAIYPFISGAVQDPNGIYIGHNEYPVFLDFFARNRERVNSNMMVIGKSGSGKSYATKTLLANFAADNTKIFILDPENEYTDLAFNVKGKVIDVGSNSMGIINPFHVMTTLQADEQEDEDDDLELEDEENQKKKKFVFKETDSSFYKHLQFLEQFFRTILVGISADSFEVLNSVVVEVYEKKGINGETRLDQLSPEDYPTFDDLYDHVIDKIEKTDNPYLKNNLIIIETYIKKFAKGGRNSSLWNGPTSIKTKENFICFNFQSLIANNNEILANAQMLLVFRYLNNEIIKNKDFNKKYGVNRKVIVAVDEAHVFINPDYPVALNFMAQMAKRIRKYGGMQLVITQNIKDFVGSEAIQRQSTAVINASQYSMIFSLAPSDLNDLVELYRKSGEINQEEQNSIVTAGVGNAFLITGPMSRSMVQIEAFSYVKKLFGE